MQIAGLSQCFSHQKVVNLRMKNDDITITLSITINNNKLQTLLITRVFATNFKVVRKYASYERHFVKIIQH